MLSPPGRSEDFREGSLLSRDLDNPPTYRRGENQQIEVYAAKMQVSGAPEINAPAPLFPRASRCAVNVTEHKALIVMERTNNGPSTVRRRDAQWYLIHRAVVALIATCH